jgi:hypothetical protein
MPQIISIFVKILPTMSNIQISLSLVEFMEDNFYIVYSPALDLSGYAMTAEEARQSFTETLAYFLEHALDRLLTKI